MVDLRQPELDARPVKLPDGAVVWGLAYLQPTIFEPRTITLAVVMTTYDNSH